MTEIIIQVTAPHFCAGVIAKDGKVISVAPILRKHVKLGWDGQTVADYCRQRGWQWVRA